ncbi:hypothetical protein P9436_15160 [Lysinibacillus capsici]|uniref:hypothetical protein n=1 Tax=Lysinibacillus capsici TaxID=2115968 RepID=UPI0001DA5A09|nr:hypothetical protein [Lysinibacillus capsici]EFI68439.1 hypothetical protein BFZC1_10237 [Lysinibacillus fusiformis ZC1]MED4700403.1 hypothetical protein [Lysinibacillus capsici]UNT53680.1 hypothetical protein ICJ70_14130 [Lysinibacillus capsici]
MDNSSREFFEAIRKIQTMMNSFQSDIVKTGLMYNDLARKASTMLTEPLMKWQEFNNSMNSSLIKALQTQQKLSLEASNTLKRSMELATSFGYLANEIRNSIPFEELAAIDFGYIDEMDSVEDDVELTEEYKAYIQQEIQTQLSAINEEEEPTATTYQEFFVKLSNSIPGQILFSILLCIFSPLSNVVSEDLQESITEVWEDAFEIDLTGEYNATIRNETYLRQGNSKTAPIVLPQKLKTGQFVIVNSRKGSWVKIMVLVGESTYTGWVEKSKILK